MATKPKIQWFVVEPNRRTHNPMSPIGTVIHAVPATEDETFGDIMRRRSICGIQPRYGWAGDMFMEQRCLRCERIMAKS